MRFYGWLSVLLQLRLYFEGETNPSFLTGDRPRKAGGEVAGEQAWGLYSFDERDLSVEPEELHEHVARVEGECAAEAVKLSQSIVEVSDALVDLGVFPIRDIPRHPMSAQDVLTAADLILEHLREEHASGVGPWVSKSARPGPLHDGWLSHLPSLPLLLV
jgi:hypothetical protein